MRSALPRELRSWGDEIGILFRDTADEGVHALARELKRQVDEESN